MRTFLDRLNITKTTLLLDKSKAFANIEFMAKKAQRCGVRLRPHFKTHQSAQIGEWFRQHEIDAITVSSVEMAQYFARHGWRDITIAIPVNLREIDAINQLAQKVTLHLVVESQHSIDFLITHIKASVHIWFKIDIGYHRAGIDYGKTAEIVAMAQAVQQAELLQLAGILTHSGHTYKAKSADGVAEIYRQTFDRMQAVRTEITAATGAKIEISIGDTPSCTLVDDLSEVDEIRAGNFVFFDLMQVHGQVCAFEQVAVAVACPVIAIHPARSEILLYGGAVHFSKDTLSDSAGQALFGQVMRADEQSWGEPVPGAKLVSLSQEHGIVRADPTFLQQTKVGDVLLILPVHSCLTANLMGDYLTLDGEVVRSMTSKKY